jgi:FtsH-binding integral membrane protein
MDKNQFSGGSYNNWEQPVEQSTVSLNEGFVAKYITKVYGWMFLGLTVTAIVAFLVASSPAALQFVFGNKLVFFGLIIGQVVVAGYLYARVNKMSAAVATMIFFAYAALLGVTLSMLLLVYTSASLVTVFALTAGTFGLMSAVGYFTKTDLTSFGKIMLMGFLGVLLASVVNFFMKSETLYWIISYVGVAVFVGLIAYDTQKIKALAYADNEEDRKKGAIIGALVLYIDFINLFIFLLRLFGGRRS